MQGGDTKPLLFRIAGSDERIAAIELQAQVYREELGFAPDDGGFPQAVYLVAVVDGLVVATARLVDPADRPFDIETFVDLSKVLPPGRRPALAGRLCIRPGHRRIPGSMRILTGLLQQCHLLAVERKWTDLVIYPRTELVAFYRGALFKDSGVSFLDPDFGLTMQLMTLDVQTLERRLRRSSHALARRSK